MRYTHYWNMREVPPKKAALEFSRQVKKLVAAAEGRGIHLCYEFDQPKRKPKVTSKEVWFNAVRPDGLETFGLRLDQTTRFDFCKTNRLPYDLVVCAILLLAHTTLPEIQTWSDGLNRGGPPDEEVIEAQKFAEEVLGITIEIPPYDN